jgi:hypothetical protein
VLKVRGIAAIGQQERHFRIEDDGRPASEASLKLVAFYTKRLFAENEIAGRCRAAADGILVLELPSTDTTYFYDGIVFAALDVFNNPNKNPTITGLPPADGSAGS